LLKFDRGVDFDDPEFGFKEEDKSSIKVYTIPIFSEKLLIIASEIMNPSSGPLLKVVTMVKLRLPPKLLNLLRSPR